MLPASPCEGLKLAQIVLVADVLQGDEPSSATDAYQPQKVKLRVIESFKGSLHEGSVTAVPITNRIGTVVLHAGSRYVVYATLRDNGEWIAACSWTKQVKETMTS